MKKQLLSLILFLMGFYLTAQKISSHEVPEAVRNIFFQKMNDSLMVVWEKSDSQYIARFKKNKLNVQMMITETGIWQATRWDIPVEYLTKKIKTYIAENYKGCRIKSVLIEYCPAGEFYLVKIAKGKNKTWLRFTVKSEFAGQEQITGGNAKPREKNQ